MKNFHLKAKARIWSCLSHVCHIHSIGSLDIAEQMPSGRRVCTTNPGCTLRIVSEADWGRGDLKMFRREYRGERGVGNAPVSGRRPPPEAKSRKVLRACVIARAGIRP